MSRSRGQSCKGALRVVAAFVLGGGCKVNIYRQVHHAPAGGQEGKLASEDSQTNTWGHPQNKQQSFTSRSSRELSAAATGSSSSSRSTGPDRGRFWRSQAAQTRLVAAAGRPPSPSAGHITHRHIHRHIRRDAGHLRGVAGAASRAEGGSREHLGVQGATDADRRRRFRGLASAGALWAPRHSYRTRTRSSQRRGDAAAAAAAVAAISVQSQSQFQLLQL